MNRGIWIGVIVALVIVVILVAFTRRETPQSVTINTPNAAVSIGGGGVAISVAPSQP